MSRFSYHLPILGYHRIGPARVDHVPTVSVQAFERQMAFLARHRFRVVDLDEVMRWLDQGEPMPCRHAVITFDDGYVETATLAWPLLRRFGFPATVFVTPGEVGLAGFATWEQLIEMAQDRITIGSHTMHHQYLPDAAPEALPQEIIESKRVIEQRIGRPVRFFSYPIGGYTAQAQALVRQAGYLAACTTNRAASRNGIDRFALRRVKMTQRDVHPLLLWAKLSGYYDAFRRLKPPS